MRKKQIILIIIINNERGKKSGSLGTKRGDLENLCVCVALACVRLLPCVCLYVRASECKGNILRGVAWYGAMRCGAVRCGAM